MSRDAQLERQLAERTILRSFLLLSLSALGVGGIGVALVAMGGKHADPVTIWMILVGVQAATLTGAADLALVLRACVRSAVMPRLRPLRLRLAGYAVVALAWVAIVSIVVIVAGADSITALAAGLISLELVVALILVQRRIHHRERRLEDIADTDGPAPSSK